MRSCVLAALFVCTVGVVASTRRYFAYGANVDVGTLRLRCGEAPRVISVAWLDAHEVVFSVPGVPFVEPSFATVRPASRSSVCGVLYELSDTAYRRMLLSEGVPLVYSEKLVDVKTAGGDPLECATLVATAELPLGIELRPSRRYMQIIVGGLRAASAAVDNHDSGAARLSSYTKALEARFV